MIRQNSLDLQQQEMVTPGEEILPPDLNQNIIDYQSNEPQHPEYINNFKAAYKEEQAIEVELPLENNEVKQDLIPEELKIPEQDLSNDIDLQQKAKKQKEELLKADLENLKDETLVLQEVTSKLEDSMIKYNQLALFKNQDSFSVSLLEGTKADLINKQFQTYQIKLKTKLNLMNKNVATMEVLIDEILEALDLLEQKVRSLLENEMIRYDQSYFESTLKILDSAVKDFQKQSSASQFFKEGLFNEEEEQENFEIQQNVHQIVRETVLTFEENDKLKLMELQTQVNQTQAEKATTEGELELIKNELARVKCYIQDKQDEKEEVVNRLQSLRVLTTSSEDLLLHNIEKLQLDDKKKQQEMIEKNKKRIEEQEERQQKILKYLDDQIMTLVQKYDLTLTSDTISSVQKCGQSLNLHLIYVLDDSGSMCGCWNDLVTGFNDSINIRRQKNQGDRVTIILFNDTARIVEQAAPITKNFNLQFNGGGTDFANAFNSCQKAFQLTKSNEIPVIIFMTDGQASHREACKILKSIYKTASQQAQTLYTFCLGFGAFDQNALTEIAKAGNGGQPQRKLNNYNFDCLFDCKNAQQLINAFNVIGKSMNSLDNIQVLIEAIQQDRKRLAQQFNETNLQDNQFKIQAYDAQSNELTKFTEALSQQTGNKKKIIQQQMGQTNKLFDKLDHELHQLHDQEKGLMEQISKLEQKISLISDQLQNSIEIQQIGVLKKKMQNELELKAKAIDQSIEKGFDVLGQERKERYRKDAHTLSEVPDFLNGTHQMIQNLLTTVFKRISRHQELFQDIAINFIETDAKKRQLINRLAVNFGVENSSDKLQDIIMRITKNKSQEIQEFLKKQLQQLDDILGAEFFYVPSKTDGLSYNELQKQKIQDDNTFVQNFKTQQIVPYFDKSTADVMRNISKKKTELNSIIKKQKQLDEYSETYDEDKRKLQKDEAKLKDQIQDFEDDLNSNDEDAKETKRLVDDAFSAFQLVRNTFKSEISIIDLGIPKDLLREQYKQFNGYINEQLHFVRNCLRKIKHSQTKMRQIK